MSANVQGRKGWALLSNPLPRQQTDSWLEKIDHRYDSLSFGLQEGGLEAVQRLIGPNQKYLPTVSSMTLGAVFPEEEIRGLVSHIESGAAGSWIREVFGSSVVCNLDQSWIRRQYAPAHYPKSHAPHGWHQDGALGFDFQNHANTEFPPDAMLDMATCWIALTPCGNNAPGLELVQQRFEQLLRPAELVDSSVQSRIGTGKSWRPVMQPGDAVLFKGDILHRTHVTPSMTEDRTSIELRFFPEHHIHARLKDDRHLALR